ncbi:lytic transglycosylase domain-containing protein [Enterovirga aerilata]|uniref:Lytic transglycosylase domain-containing protein n=1 Tax=Enterovirga aerilata TaxID=2730920 RepID=A0A849IAJ3_9HYPH|nr:lytic transglycosylase domain-containing protein [Enterovirga sp. DB1703]NNM73275.1 lytic transglycosylase domain-containing protein [Enterovirga sp. DB1703]
MFLFTTPAEPRASAAATPVVDAIRQGAEQTGTSFEYLLSTARRESALDPAARAATSSAAGLFQFVEQTWLGLMKSEGGRLGLSDLSAAITARGDGTYAVPDGSAREAILKLREDPRLASMMAGALTQQNRQALAAATGREPSGGELYMAHLLGARGATDLIRTASRNPERPVAPDMPEAAAANRPIFFDRTGRARSAGELYALLGAAAGPAPVPTPPGAPRTITATGQPAVTRTGEGPPLHGLFRNDVRTGPVSDAVAKLWRVNRGAGEQRAAFGYFPRGDGAEVALAAEPEAAVSTGSLPVAGIPAEVPLPPPRPRAAGPAANARLATTGLPR